ncbi:MULTISPECIES: RidA family protein [Paenibacillus]|uniref:Endoribonuclease L-PSP n=1 Tax=Paenibacillus naphthalenovorans TaxID=162209 RepID=A0A0U2UBJ8_9BACL|nr:MULTISPECIES: Rid family hydrolase [Paenibacillus]ALS23576.1 endoribonuclease L-PSP [Paenibacillus naphthalenovorans]NTZ20674.1 RidA family protein [Paenibacillus sp. JMULE4]GCL74358.1 RidA family protein [Paenibacillus naphthalenovorans]SDJ01667.1 2-iminobutanoate/2-iminopropanoate deaminase [Paenibacillus naphthalenovorans]
MARRKSIEIKGVNHHGTIPIPLGAKVGRFVFSSAIAGVDPAIGKIPDEPEKQIELVFDHVHRFMEVAGGTSADIGRMTVYLQDEQYRDLVNQAWVSMFPDAANRPARHTVVKDLRAGALVQVEITAVLREEA